MNPRQNPQIMSEDPAAPPGWASPQARNWVPPEPTSIKGVKSLIERVTEKMPPGGYANDAELARAHQVALRELVKDQGKDPDSPQAQQWMFSQLQTVADPSNPKGRTVRTLLLKPPLEKSQWLHLKPGEVAVDPHSGQRYEGPTKDETPEQVKTQNMMEYSAHEGAMQAGSAAQGQGKEFVPAYMEHWQARSPMAIEQAKQKSDAAKAEREAKKLALEEQQAKSKEALTQSAVSLNVAKADELANKLPDAKRLEYDTHRDELRGLVNERVKAAADPMMDEAQRASRLSAIDTAIKSKHAAINELLKQPEAKADPKKVLKTDFATVEEAEASKLPKGTRITVGGKPAIVE